MNQTCFAERIVRFFPIKFFRNILFTSKNPPWWEQGKKILIAQKWLYSASLQSDNLVSEVSSLSTTFPFCIHSSHWKVESEIQTNFNSTNAGHFKTSHWHCQMMFNYLKASPIAVSREGTCREWPGWGRAVEESGSVTDSKVSLRSSRELQNQGLQCDSSVAKLGYMALTTKRNPISCGMLLSYCGVSSKGVPHCLYQPGTPVTESVSFALPFWAKEKKDRI